MYTSAHRPSGPDAPGTPPWIGVGAVRGCKGGAGPAPEPAVVAGPEVTPAATAGAGVVGGPPGKSRPTVSAWFMTRMSSEEAPCRPKGTTFHSNWPSCDRKLVFHRSALRTRSW